MLLLLLLCQLLIFFSKILNEKFINLPKNKIFNTNIQHHCGLQVHTLNKLPANSTLQLRFKAFNRPNKTQLHTHTHTNKQICKLLLLLTHLTLFVIYKTMLAIFFSVSILIFYTLYLPAFFLIFSKPINY